VNGHGLEALSIEFADEADVAALQRTSKKAGGYVNCLLAGLRDCRLEFWFPKIVRTVIKLEYFTTLTMVIYISKFNLIFCWNGR
jgi:hypothetical protein